ncbi:MAG: hypothetical protein LBS29_05015 [Endomicrobium sp.]|jgi:hypothetical protein|nr:hypothetical protein [Endomicrobium sp.]
MILDNAKAILNTIHNTVKVCLPESKTFIWPLDSSEKFNVYAICDNRFSNYLDLYSHLIMDLMKHKLDDVSNINLFMFSSSEFEKLSNDSDTIYYKIKQEGTYIPDILGCL